MLDLIAPPAAHRAGLAPRFAAVRAHTETLARPLTAEDQCIQSMPDASPAKWHRAHTTWFFEQFVLTPNMPGYRTPDPRFAFLFNSYYDTVGDRQPRAARGLVTRPSADDVTAYRAHVDAAMDRLLRDRPDLAELVELGLQHEQQHQELLLTDIMHAFAQNPLLPACVPGWNPPVAVTAEMGWAEFPGGLVEVGHPGGGFAFDNEGPRHRAFLQPFRLADRLVLNEEWIAFIDAGGYATPTLWMSDGWATAQQEGWSAPLYWRRERSSWRQFGPDGEGPLDPRAPVRHVSWYEADAFARWSKARLPTEAEWEHAADSGSMLHDMTGQVWQWTESAYRPYPGFQPPPGAIGEYNGKFMINTMVLRGGSWATPPGHARTTYRNFFHPDRRWQVTGLRLARPV